ncbi:MAG: TolB family protein [Gaiellaceae bacterium]
MSARVVLVAALAATALGFTGANGAQGGASGEGIFSLDLRTHTQKRFQLVALGLELSPDRRRMAYVIRKGNDDLQLRVRRLDGSSDHLLLESPLPSFLGNLSWSPDGRTIAVPWDPTGCGITDASCIGLWLIRTSGRPPEKLSDDAVDAVWAPDSKRLAFSGEMDGGGQALLTVENVDGSERRTFGSRTPITSLSWSGNGTRLLYSTNEWGTPWRGVGPVGDIHVVTPSIGLDSVIAKGWTPAWSDDGKLISFARTTRNGMTLFLHEGKRTNAIMIRPKGYFVAAWSRHGHRLAIGATDRYGQSRVYVLDADRGTSPRPVTPRAYGGIRSISWSPDGRRLIFVRLNN